MVIQTAVFGEMDIPEEQIFHMPDGLFGFEEDSRFALIAKQDDDVTLMWFQSVNHPVPCFVVFNPFEIIDGYEPVLEPGDLKKLECNASDLQFLVLAVVPEDISKITVNLKSPVVLNRKTGKARQVILQNQEYPIRFPLTEPDASGAKQEAVEAAR